MRKVSKLFLLISLSFLLTFNSCNNVFENSVSAEENTNAQNNASQTDDKTGSAVNRPSSNPAATIVFGGTLAINGAVPAEFVEPEEAAENQQSGRSANAELPGSTDYEYYVKATSNDGLVHEDIIPAASISKDYSLQLEINKTWTFTAGYRKKASGTPDTDSYVAPVNLLIDIDSDSGHPYSLTLSETVINPATQKVFTLKPLQNGSGTIDLVMTVPTGINDLKLFTSGENGVLIPWQTDTLDVTTTSIKTKENMTIASGSYDVTMIFYKHDTNLNRDFQAYITYQTINVFDNMKTKVWESGNAPGTESIISGGSFQLTTSLVQKFASSTIYVGAPEGVTVEPDDSRVGSPYAPVRTLNRAFEIIKANTSGDGNTRDYRILVTTAKPTAEKAAQPQKANLEIPADITTSQAKSIEIVGIGSAPELRPAATNPGTVLTVNTAVPVKLSNIKITGGQGSGGKGGAISITQNSAKVTLGSGTVITGNEASDQGGGIYIQGTDASHKPKLIIQNGAEIKSNSIGTSGTGGMAIFADCAEVEMTGGEISGNSKAGAQYGAVRLTGASEFTMTGGSVANNDGGAFYVDSTYDSGTSTYTHSKLKIGGSARIPYGVNGTTGQKKNDVYIVRANQTDPSGGKYSPLEIAGAITVEDGTKIAAITPDGWQRGLDILKTNSGIINDYKDYFITTDPYFILSNQATAQISKLKAPVVVSNNPSKNPSDSNSGTREHPYATLAFALSQLGGGEEDTILIDGLISTPSEEANGKYEIPASFIVSQCSALTLKGANGLNTDGTPKDGFAVPEGGSGSVLTVDSPVPVKIENLKLTGGKGSEYGSHYVGGGLYIISGTVTLVDGAQVTGNRATHGAGVYVNSGATLYMYGSSLIGDKKGNSITSAPSVYSQASNYCLSGPGGGIYTFGNVFIGYERWASDTDNTPKLMTEGYGIMHNFAGSHGGGLIVMGGKFRMASGTIGINHSGSNGGGVCDFSCTDCVFAGGSIEENVAENGGAIYICSDYITELKNNLEIKNNEATTAGGAVYVAGTLKIQDAVSIPYGVNGSLGAKKNDVYLNTDKTITVSGSFSSSAPVTVATITLPWARGAQFLQAGDTLTSLPDGIIDKFAFTDAGWDKKRYTKNSTNDAAKIDADIYVAGSNPAKCKKADGTAYAASDTNTIGNWAHPFASISAALSSGLLDASHDTIIVDGSVSSAQSISGTGSLSAVAIKGYKAAGATSSSAKIDAGGLTGAGSALTVNADGKTVTIQDLTITGGNASGSGDAANGGGIRIAAGSTVRLADGALVTGNKATNGGGVYVAGMAKLLMYGTAWIGDSSEKQATSATLTLSGSTTGSANSATDGGGIYNYGGTVALGYEAYTDAISNSPKDFTGGVGRNYAENGGAGIAGIGGTTDIRKGKISYNYAKEYGGGIYGKFIFSGGSVNNNMAHQGGGFYIPEAVTDAKITGGSISQNSVGHAGGGAYISNNAKLTLSGDADISNNGANYGGGIYTVGNDSTFEMSDGSLISNTASVMGGAICNTNGTVIMSGGTIGESGKTNTVVNSSGRGGAIYQAGTFKMSSSALIYPGTNKSNDVYLESGRCLTVASTTLTGGTTVASITPNSFSRSRQILDVSSSITLTETQLNTIKGKIALTEDGWNKENIITSSVYTGVKINSPIYVASTAASDSTRKVCSPGVTSGAKGTTAKPYATIEAALGDSDLAVAGNKITIDGTIGKQEIAPSASLSAVTIAGYKAGSDTTSSATIDAGGTTGAGSALTVNKSGLTVTITDLTITGGSGSSMTVGGAAQTNGGGILLNAGTVKLSDGAVITGNAVANNGGGVYLSASGCALYMSGKALIGDSATSTTRASGAANNRANQAANGAGIYNNGGSVFIGSNTSGTAASGYSLVNDDTNGHYGVRRNYSTTSGAGAGIYHAGGTLKIASGDISNNNAGEAGAGTCNGGGVYCAADVDISGGTFKNNYAANGGGLYIATGKKATVNGAAVFTQNQSWVNGGAVYNAGEFTMSAGTIGGSDSSDANLAAGSAGLASYGGAIYQGGTFNVSGSAYVSSGTLKINDVYLPSNKKVTIDSTWSGSQASNKMTLTPSTWARGSQVLAGNKAAYYYTYFNTSDSEWSVGYKESSWTLTDDLKTRIGADIYVAGSENRASGISAPSETASERIGTKLKPFNSIEEGVKACWTTTLPFTVKFSGTITGTAQTIPAGSTSTGGLASAITIEGVQGNSKDIINRNLSTATNSGTALTINTATPVTIKKIKITGGYNRNASGGGIRANVAGASLTLGEGALVTANNVTSSTTYDSGGGVYIEGTSASPATFIMESDATISGNDSGQGSGGGVGLKYATLCMTGSALIGDKDATSAATGDSGKHSNSAQSGGGVYVGTGSKLRLGYATPTATTGTSLDAAYGIRYNYVYNAGGGVFVEAGSSVEIASGSISCNGTIANAQYKNGGGIYLNETATLTMTGGTIAKNKAYDGGGVYLYGNTSTGSSIVMSGGTIGDSSSGVTSAATGSDEKFSNYAAHDGGGIYAATAKNTVTLNGGNVSYNYSARQGGGIYTKTDTAFKANAKYNGAGGSGGGIYSTGGTTLTMTAGTIYGNKASATADTDEGRLWCGGGGVWFEGTFKMSGGTIQGNSATWYGGGVGTGDGIFYMSGSAVIGDKSKTAVPDASETTSPTANRAQYGGGFAATNDPDIYLGYSGKTGSTLNASSLASGGICYNYASKHGGGYYQKSGGRPLIMATGNIDYNKAADSASQGGGIYTEAGLQMTGCTITGNAASNGGAILLKKCVYKVAGNIYIPYDSASGSANRENTVQMMGTESKITVTGSLTNTNSTVMTVEPHTWAIGTLVADKDTSLSSDNFKTSVAKIGIVKNNIYSKVEPIGGTYNNSSAVSKAVVGIDFSTVTQSNILSYMSGKTWSLSSAEPYPSNELNYFFLCDKTSPNSRYAILKVIHYNSMDCGKFIASSVLIGSTNQESNLTTVDYDTSTSEIREYATWNPFKVTSPTYADYIVVYKQDHSIGMQLGSNYLGWYKVQ